MINDVRAKAGKWATDRGSEDWLACVDAYEAGHAEGVRETRPQPRQATLGEMAAFQAENERLQQQLLAYRNSREQVRQALLAKEAIEKDCLAEIARLREWISWAKPCLERGVELMPDHHLAQWNGVRGVIESAPDLAGTREEKRDGS